MTFLKARKIWLTFSKQIPKLFNTHTRTQTHIYKTFQTRFDVSFSPSMVFIITKEDIQLEQLQVLESQLIFYFLNLTMYLESTDAARRVPHPSPTRPNAVTRASVLCLSFFFFFFSSDSCRLSFNSHWTRLIWPESGRISHIRSYQPATETSRNRPWI